MNDYWWASMLCSWHKRDEKAGFIFMRQDLMLSMNPVSTKDRYLTRRNTQVLKICLIMMYRTNLFMRKGSQILI